MDLMTEFHRVTSALAKAGIDYAVCGGLAVAVHGFTRATKDIDLLVPPDQIPAALEALEPLGFRFRANPMTFPDGMRIQRVTRIEGRDLMTVDLLLVGTETDAAWASRSLYKTSNGPVWVISREALIQLKLWAGRPQDLADVDRLTNDDR